jgi:hypothetical protein
MPVILATQEAAIRRIVVQSQHGLTIPYLKKPFTKIGLVEWLKVKVMSSSPSTTKKKKSLGRLLVLAILVFFFCQYWSLNSGPPACYGNCD